MASVRFPVGRVRIDRFVSSAEAGATRDARASMDRVAKNLKRVIAAIENASPAGLAYALEPIYETSQELVPVDTGKLKRSGYIDARKTGRGIVAEVGYGKGGNPHYTAFVHERLDIYHKPPTQAKFLEEAVNQHQHEVLDRYAQFMKRGLGFGS